MLKKPSGLSYYFEELTKNITELDLCICCVTASFEQDEVHEVCSAACRGYS